MRNTFLKIIALAGLCLSATEHKAAPAYVKASWLKSLTSLSWRSLLPQQTGIISPHRYTRAGSCPL
jgi:hypothetical protein